MMNRGTHQHDHDKLSHLPDCVLVHILSFLNLKEAVRTGSLSRRWKHLWKGLQTLSFNGIRFINYNDFTEFANQVLSIHDPSIAITALDFLTRYPISPHLLETASRNQNLKRLSLFSCCIQTIPNFLFSCHRLESLKLECRIIDRVVFPDSLNLPALTYLNILGLVFRSGDNRCAKPFSGFNRLNSLIIKDCRCEKYSQTLCISNVMLVNLVIDSILLSEIELSAPSLCTFTFKACYLLKLYGSSLSCVKHVSIDGDVGGFSDGVIPTLLIELVNMESLTISSETIWALSYIPHSVLLKSKHTSLSNLKSLQVILCSHEQYPRKEFLHKQILIMMRDVNHEVAGGKPWKGNVKLREAIKALKPYAFIPRVIDFLIQNSTSANVDILIPKQPNGYYFL